jgi:hypothetical protein
MIKLTFNQNTYWFKLEDILLVERLLIYTSDYAVLQRGLKKIRITLKNTNTKIIEFEVDEATCDKILSLLEVPFVNRKELPLVNRKELPLENREELPLLPAAYE